MGLSLQAFATISTRSLGFPCCCLKADSVSGSVSAPQTRTLSIKKYSMDYICTKLYEDASRGIVCYKNGVGELICEGYDEGSLRMHSYVMDQEDQLKEDAKLYLCTQGLRPHLIEGKDYTCYGEL